MRLPQTSLPPLAPPLEALRQQINALPTDDRKAVMGRMWGDTIRLNDARDQERYEMAERARRANARKSAPVVAVRPAPVVRRPRVRQLALLEAS